MSPATATPRPKLIRCRRWRWTIIAVAMVVAVWLLHVPLFRSVGSFLAADEPLEKADYIVIVPSMAGDRAAIDMAIERVRRGAAAGVLCFQAPETRAERCGAWPSYQSAMGDYLKKRSVPDGSIVFLPGPSRTSWEAGRALDKWLSGRTGVRLDVLCRRLSGRCERQVLGAVLTPAAFTQLHFAAADNRIDETNWWHDREGIQMVFQAYTQLAYVFIHGETQSKTGAWTLEQYEQSLPAIRPTP